METITTADGRTLAYEVVGDPDGTAVFWQHGTGDSRRASTPTTPSPRRWAQRPPGVLEPMFEAEFAAASSRAAWARSTTCGASSTGAPEDVTQHVEMFVGDADDILDPGGRGLPPDASGPGVGHRQEFLAIV